MYLSISIGEERKSILIPFNIHINSALPTIGENSIVINSTGQETKDHIKLQIVREETIEFMNSESAAPKDDMHHAEESTAGTNSQN